MLGRDIVRALNAQPVEIRCEELLDTDYDKVFASDLMSDVLAMVQESASTILVTGLCNAQALRTAEMLDLELIIFVRGKSLPKEMLNIAIGTNFNIFTTDCTMYEVCGLLYELGLGSIYGRRFT